MCLYQLRDVLFAEGSHNFAAGEKQRGMLFVHGCVCVCMCEIRVRHVLLLDCVISSVCVLIAR